MEGSSKNEGWLLLLLGIRDDERNVKPAGAVATGSNALMGMGDEAEIPEWKQQLLKDAQDVLVAYTFSVRPKKGKPHTVSLMNQMVYRYGHVSGDGIYKEVVWTGSEADDILSQIDRKATEVWDALPHETHLHNYPKNAGPYLLPFTHGTYNVYVKYYIALV